MFFLIKFLDENTTETHKLPGEAPQNDSMIIDHGQESVEYNERGRSVVASSHFSCRLFEMRKNGLGSIIIEYAGLTPADRELINWFSFFFFFEAIGEPFSWQFFVSFSFLF